MLPTRGGAHLVEGNGVSWGLKGHIAEDVSLLGYTGRHCVGSSPGAHASGDRRRERECRSGASHTKNLRSNYPGEPSNPRPDVGERPQTPPNPRRLEISAAPTRPAPRSPRPGLSDAPLRCVSCSPVSGPLPYSLPGHRGKFFLERTLATGDAYYDTRLWFPHQKR